VSGCRGGPAAGQAPELRQLHNTPTEVHNLLQSTKERAAAGPDGLPAVLLKRYAVSLAPSLTQGRWTQESCRPTGKLPAQNLGFVSRNLHGCSLRVRRIAYLSLVQPIMTFGLPAWHPTIAENTQKTRAHAQESAEVHLYGRRLQLLRQQNIMPVEMHFQHTDFVF